MHNGRRGFNYAAAARVAAASATARAASASSVMAARLIVTCIVTPIISAGRDDLDTVRRDPSVIQSDGVGCAGSGPTRCSVLAIHRSASKATCQRGGVERSIGAIQRLLSVRGAGKDCSVGGR